MKRKLIFLGSVMLTLSIISFGIVQAFSNKQPMKQEKVTIVTSFYPMYIIAMNLTEHMDNVEVVNLTDNNVGCLHDYQLTTKDMRTLNDADVLILNGGDMELFLEDVVTMYPSLEVIDASEHISLLEGIEHVHGEDVHAEDTHEHEIHTEDYHGADSHTEDVHTEDPHVDENVDIESHDSSIEDAHAEEDSVKTEDIQTSSEDSHNHEGHVHSDINGHVWLDMNRYLVQIETIANALSRYDLDNADLYLKNANIYMEKVSKLKDEFEETFSELEGIEIVGFHGAFAYLADELSFEMIYSLDMDSDTVLSAGEIATVIEEVKEHKVKYLLAEDQYSKDIAKRIAEETNANVYLLETLVSGELNKDAYLTGMHKNLTTLKNMLFQ